MSKEKSPTPKTVFDLIPDQDNANKGTERGSGLLENILRTHGFIGAIAIDEDNKVIAGNKTLQAAIDAGIVRVRVIDTDGNEVIASRRKNVKLDSKVGRELATGHNRIGELSLCWDPQILATQAEEYDIDLNALGISPGELQGLLEDAQNPDEPREPKGKKPVVCPHCGETFTPK